MRAADDSDRTAPGTWSPVDGLVELYDPDDGPVEVYDPDDGPGSMVVDQPPHGPAIRGPRRRWLALGLGLAAVAALVALTAHPHPRPARVGAVLATGPVSRSPYPGPEPVVQPFVGQGPASVQSEPSQHRFQLLVSLTYQGGGGSTASATVRLVDAAGRPVQVVLAMLTDPRYADRLRSDAAFVPPGLDGVLPGARVLMLVRQRVPCPTSRGAVAEPSVEFTYGGEAGHEVFAVPWNELVTVDSMAYSSLVHAACSG